MLYIFQTQIFILNSSGKLTHHGTTQVFLNPADKIFLFKCSRLVFKYRLDYFRSTSHLQIIYILPKGDLIRIDGGVCMKAFIIWLDGNIAHVNISWHTQEISLDDSIRMRFSE